MPHLIIPRDWKQAPSGLLQVDGASGLSTGLDFLISGQGGTAVPYDLASRISIPFAGTTEFSLGRGIRHAGDVFSQSSNGYYRRLNSRGVRWPFTLFGLYYSESTATCYSIPGIAIYKNGTGSYHVGAWSASTGANWVRAGGDGGTLNTNTADLTVVARPRFVLLSVHGVNEAHVYVDGRRQYSGSGTYYEPDSTWYIGTGFIQNRNFTNTNGSDQFRLSFGGVLNRAVSEAEAADWSANPWRLFKPRTARIYSFPSGGAGITATASITEAADTLSATATVKVAGTLAVTEAGDALASTAAVKVAATASITEAADTLAATLAVGNAPITATASITEAADTLSATGTVKIAATLAKTEASDTLAATGTVKIAGALAVTEAADTLASTIVVGSAPITGTASITESSDTLAATAAVKVAAVANITEGNDTLATVAGVVIKALLNATEADDTLFGYIGDAPVVAPQTNTGGGGAKRKPSLRDHDHPYWRSRALNDEAPEEAPEAIAPPAPASNAQQRPPADDTSPRAAPVPGADIVKALLGVPNEAAVVNESLTTQPQLSDSAANSIDDGLDDEEAALLLLLID